MQTTFWLLTQLFNSSTAPVNDGRDTLWSEVRHNHVLQGRLGVVHYFFYKTINMAGLGGPKALEKTIFTPWGLKWTTTMSHYVWH